MTSFTSHSVVDADVYTTILYCISDSGESYIIMISKIMQNRVGDPPEAGNVLETQKHVHR